MQIQIQVKLNIKLSEAVIVQVISNTSYLILCIKNIQVLIPYKIFQKIIGNKNVLSRSDILLYYIKPVHTLSPGIHLKSWFDFHLTFGQTTMTLLRWSLKWSIFYPRLFIHKRSLYANIRTICNSNFEIAKKNSLEDLTEMSESAIMNWINHFNVVLFS